VRAMMTMSESMLSRAALAARMRLMKVGVSTSCLPWRWPQRFVWTWSSIWKPATPLRAYCCTVRVTTIGPRFSDKHMIGGEFMTK
jgi:hypothetical protein